MKRKDTSLKALLQGVNALLLLSHMTNMNELQQQIISEIQRIAKEQNLTTLSRSSFKRYSRISERQIYKAFASWNEAIALAGLQPNTSCKKKSDNELFEELLRVCKDVGYIPKTMAFERLSPHSPDPYTRRWGTWNDVLIKFKDWLKEKHPDSKFIDLLPEKSKPKAIINPQRNNTQSDFVWESKKGIVYGPPIDFCGLRHAPVNEQGVVFLFGKISEKLDFSIEAIRTAYPDCTGKRLIDRNKNLWESVSIEFEYRSRNFVEHGHDPEKCDVIICWIHDWTDCPLEVIELREVIKRLKKS